MSTEYEREERSGIRTNHYAHVSRSNKNARLPFFSRALLSTIQIGYAQVFWSALSAFRFLIRIRTPPFVRNILAFPHINNKTRVSLPTWDESPLYLLKYPYSGLKKNFAKCHLEQYVKGQDYLHEFYKRKVTVRIPAQPFSRHVQLDLCFFAGHTLDISKNKKNHDVLLAPSKAVPPLLLLQWHQNINSAQQEDHFNII